MSADHRHRPPQPPTPAADAFTIHRAEVADGVSLAYVREGTGYPLLLLHGYPETKRIWWRTIEPLVAAGYEVIVPDLRGYGDSDLAPDDHYDLARYSRDLHALVHDVLGHTHCGAVGGDVGGAVLIDMVHRFEGFVDKLCFFNSVPPILVDDYTAAGIDLGSIRSLSSDHPSADYRIWQGTRPDELAAELTTDAARRGYVAGMYTHRLWASPGSFTDADVDFMTEPFADEARLRAGWAVYQLGHGRAQAEPAMLSLPVEIPTLLFYGADDHVVGPDFVRCCEVAFRDRVGPFVMPLAGHFLQWERADLLNPALVHFFADQQVR